MNDFNRMKTRDGFYIQVDQEYYKLNVISESYNIGNYVFGPNVISEYYNIGNYVSGPDEIEMRTIKVTGINQSERFIYYKYDDSCEEYKYEFIKFYNKLFRDINNVIDELKDIHNKLVMELIENERKSKEFYNKNFVYRFLMYESENNRQEYLQQLNERKHELTNILQKCENIRGMKIGWL